MTILGRSLAMNTLSYTSAQIGLAAAIGSAVAIPLPIWLGNLSDRYARVNLLAICYGTVGLSLVLLAMATAQWHFWIASLLMAVSSGTGGIVNALVADLVPPKLIGTGLAYTNGARWIGAIIGFLGTGYKYLSRSKSALLTAVKILIVPKNICLGTYHPSLRHETGLSQLRHPAPTCNPHCAGDWPDQAPAGSNNLIVFYTHAYAYTRHGHAFVLWVQTDCAPSQTNYNECRKEKP